MPEGDTVYLTARRLDAAIGGRELLRSDFRVPRYATLDLSGRRVRDVAARGKHLLVRLSGGTTIHAHLKMEGSFRLHRRGERFGTPATDIRLVLETDPWVALGISLGNLDLVRTEAEDEIVGYLGPDLLGADWDAEEATRRISSAPDVPIAEALLDQRNLAGIGNVYKSELCFLRGLHPDTRVGAVADVPALVDLARRALWANRDHARHITTGDTRRGRTRWVYGRRGLPCRRCGTPIAKAAASGDRVTYWCPVCQPGPKG